MGERYNRVKRQVLKATPKFISVTVVATKAQKRGGLKVIDRLEELFGPKGKYWMKGSYHTVQEGMDSFCLSGGLNKIDGEHEAVARAAISLAIAELFPLRGLRTAPGELSDMLGGDEVITSFNDDEYVKWADVRKVLGRARQLLA